MGVEDGSPRGELSLKVTEGWLGATILQHPATPHRLTAELPSRGATLLRGLALP